MRTLSRLAALALLAAVWLVIAAGPAAAQREQIIAFDSDVTVRPDGILHVVETIDVMVTGGRIRHGIFRDFPTRSLTPDGFNSRVGFDITGITRDGAAEPYAIKPLAAGVRIYIGDPDAEVPPGLHRYAIAYDTSRQLLFHPDNDELYWNVTGNDWAFPIVTARVTVHLPNGAIAGPITGYTGPTGARGRDFQVTKRQGGTVKLETTRPLGPNEGFTIAVAWPKGPVARPTAGDDLLRLALDNMGLTLGASLLVVLIGYFLVVWHRVGRDPRKGVVFPRFEAPNQLSPVAVGYIWNDGFSDGFDIGRALTVAITSLATKRRLTIADDGDGQFTLSAVAAGKVPTGKSPWTRLPPGESAVYHKLFADDEDSVSFGDSYVPKMGEATAALRDAFGWEYGQAYFRNNSRAWLTGALIAAASVFSTLVIDASGEDAWLITAVMAVFGSALQVIATVMIILLAARWWRAATAGGPWRPALSLGQLAGAVGAFAASGLVGVVLADMVAPMALPVAALPVPVTVLFFFLMKAPTRLGRETLDAIEGYRLYLSVAEADRLNSAGREPEITEALYEAHLPYAMALGVEEQWTGKVMSRLEASTEDPSRPYRYEPDWYRGSGRDFSASRTLPVALTEGLGGAASHAIVRPSSSGTSDGGGFSSGGFSSGGSSGGGGGGGGGGGW